MAPNLNGPLDRLRGLRAAPTPLLAMAEATVTGLWALTGLRRPVPPREHHHTLTLSVVGRQVVAHDENVVALTLAAPDGSEMDVFHASARGTQDGIYEMAPAGEIRQQIGRAPALVAVGHTHLPFIRQVDETLVVNCGSAGAPCDDDRRASYAQIEWRAGEWRARIVRVAYDLGQTDRDFRQSGFLALGPMADLIYHEWRIAHQVVIPWLRQEKPRVLAGEVTMAESVRGFLQQLGLV